MPLDITWVETTLGEHVRFVSGGTPSKSNPDLWGGDTPWVTAKDMKSLWINGTEDKLTQRGSEHANWIAPAGTILMLVRGMTLHHDIPIVRLKVPAAFNQDVKAVVPGPAINPDYLFYLLRSHKLDLLEAVDAAGHGTGRLASEALNRMMISLPPLSQQQMIQEALTAIDEKVELNNAITVSLEETARALFQSWFVDFDPVHAKAERRDPGIPVDIAALFPDGFGDHGLPQGWHSGTLERLAEVNPESWSNRSHPDMIEYVDLANTKFGVIEATSHFLWDSAPSRARRVARTGDSLIGTVRPGNGSYAYVSRDGYTVSTGFAVLRAKKPEYRDAIYIAATTEQNIQRMTVLAAGHGGAYPAINPSVVAESSFPVVPDDLMTAYSRCAAAIRVKIENLRSESMILHNMLDLIIPKMLSGELAVASAASAVAAA